MRPRPSGWMTEKGDFGQREPEGLLHLPDGWRQGDRTHAPRGTPGKIDAAKARRKARVMKAAALVIKLQISRIESNIHV
jgi:hypothetical protein